MLDQIPFARAIVELANDGGPFVVWIFLSGVLLWAMVAERWWYFSRVLPRQAAKTRAEWEAAENG